VEEATAASQAMAEQVRGLNEMLARFQVGMTDTAAPVSAPAPRKPKPAATAVASRVERRGANRPWAGRGGAARTARHKPDAEPASREALPVAVHGGAPPSPEVLSGRSPLRGSPTRGNGTIGTSDTADTEWQEF